MNPESSPSTPSQYSVQAAQAAAGGKGAIQAVFDPATGQANATLLGDFLWTNVNFGEAVTEPMTPLAWSVLEFTLDDWIFLPGYATTGNIGGCPYLNISALAALYLALGRSRDDFLARLEGTLYLRLPDDVDIPRIPLNLAGIAAGLAQVARVQRKYRQGVKALPAYLAANPDSCRLLTERITATGSGRALAALWQQELKPHVKHGVWVVLGTVDYATGDTMALRRELIALLGPEDAHILMANVGAADATLPSLGPLVGLAQLARGEVSREAYLAHYGHRGPHEFEISVPRPAEDPGWLDLQLAQLRESPVDPEALLARQRQAFAAAWERLNALPARQAIGIRHRIVENARRARLREEARSEYVRDRWLVRRFAVRAGELTGLGDDVFYLTLPEVLGLLEGDASAIPTIPARRQTHLRYQALPPYPQVIRGPFDPFQWAADPRRRSDIFDAHAPLAARAPATGDLTVLAGSPAAAGRVEGLVRRLDRAEDGPQLQPGEVLVTALTDIAWTPLFARAAAIVTDIGAPLSHAAIVARELGIPAVVGCGDATVRLHTGDRVRVDGSRGTVEILNR